MNGQPWSEESERARFRPAYRKLSDAEQAHADAIKDKAAELAILFQQIPQGVPDHPKPGRYRALALTDLEKSVMWAIKELTA